MYVMASDEFITGGGRDFIYGGSGNDTLTAGSGMDDIYYGNSGSNTNDIYPNGDNDLLMGGLGNNTIHSVQDIYGRELLDGLTVQCKGTGTGGYGYGGTNPEVLGHSGSESWAFSIDSTARLGSACTATEAQVFVSWDHAAVLGSGNHWADHVQYAIYDGSTLLNTLDVNQARPELTARMPAIPNGPTWASTRCPPATSFRFPCRPIPTPPTPIPTIRPTTPTT